MLQYFKDENTNAHTCGCLTTRPYAWILVQPILHESWHVLAVFVCHVGLSCYVGIHPVAHTSFFTTRGAVVWAFSNSSTHQFSRTQRGLVCGRLSLRPHARLLAHTQSWQLPCVFAGYMATALALLVSRWQLSFTRVAICFCMVHGNCPSVHVSRWQL